MATTREAQLERIVLRAIAVLQKHLPPDGLTDAQAIDRLYGIQPLL